MGSCFIIELVFSCFLTTYVFDNIASTVGFAEVFQKYRQSIRIMTLLKCISIMIHFGKCIKYQYYDTILNQVSVSVLRYNSEVSYPTLGAAGC